MLGLKHDHNLLVDYDAAWPEEFRLEAERLRATVSGFDYSIEHYGSTSVPGLRAKPILDILLGIRPFEEWKILREPLERLGYDYAEHAGVPGHHIFGKGRDMTERTHLLHVVELDGAEWRSAISFRDALRSNAQLQRRYLLAKEQAAAEAPIGRAAYNEIKSKFFASIGA